MKKSRLLAFVLCFIMLVSMFPQNFVFAETDENTGKGQRQVYLHAFDETPKDNTSENRHTVYMGEDVNVFLSVTIPIREHILMPTTRTLFQQKKQQR